MEVTSGQPRLTPVELKPLDHVLTLSKRQQDSLTDMWAVLEPEMESIGVEIFQRILQLCPEAIRMFYFGQTVHSAEDIVRNKEFRFHGLRFMEVVRSVVINVKCDMDRATAVLRNLGQLHCKIRNRGFRPQYWSIFKMCLVEAVCQRLQDASAEGFDADEIWESVAEFIIAEMRIGFNHQTPHAGDFAL